ncbi:hypothetical protein [Bradyrhizobium sp. 150]|uniref:hypothetical protein n=1 Tax=Bradyrhizobium sp. 150 TaxID=2782625 RepID=UPI001FFBB0CB|nr:hypothetical protein [Bradyrhizobium sp. 150]
MAFSGPAWSYLHPRDFAPEGVHPAADEPQPVLARADPASTDTDPEFEDLLAFSPRQHLKLPWRI